MKELNTPKILTIFLIGWVMFSLSFWVMVSDGEDPPLKISPVRKKFPDREQNYFRSLFKKEFFQLESLARALIETSSFPAAPELLSHIELAEKVAIIKEKFHLDHLDFIPRKGPLLTLLEREEFRPFQSKKIADNTITHFFHSKISTTHPQEKKVYFMVAYSLESNYTLLIGRELSGQWLRQLIQKRDEIIFFFDTKNRLLLSSLPRIAPQSELFMNAEKCLKNRTPFIDFQGTIYQIHQFPLFLERDHRFQLTLLQTSSLLNLTPFPFKIFSPSTLWALFSLFQLLLVIFFIYLWNRALTGYENGIMALINESEEKITANAPSSLLILKEKWRKRKIGQEKSTEEKFQKDKLAIIGQFSTGIAHEINNPLGIISTTAEYLMNHSELNSEQKEEMQEIIKQTLRCKRILNSLLLFSKKTEVNLKTTDINQVIRDMIRQLPKLTETREINFAIKEEQLPLIQTDQDLLHQILLNIYKNAIESIPFRGKIETDICFDREMNSVIIQICDDGIGIEPEQQKNIFNPFFTLKERGTGLGLPLCLNLIRQLGGNINFDSKIGEGTEFNIILPLKDEEKTTLKKVE